MFYTYILCSNKNNRYYVGSCENLEKRLNQHNSGIMKSTKGYTPWKIVYSEKYNSLSKARQRELQIKSWKSRNEIEKLIKTFVICLETENPR